MTLNFYTLGVLYLVYSFLGWAGETVVATFRGKRFANRGMAAGPFCFVYGTTAILMAVGFADMRTKPVALFVACMLTATVVEWLTAKLLERLHNRKWWDYSDKKFNLNGYVCLQYSVLWGALGMVTVLWGNGLLLASVLLAAFLGQRYPTDWQARKDAPQDETIRQELLELGFPEAVLNDLTADEVAALDGAAEVYVQEDTKWGKNTYREVTTDKWYDDALPSNWKYDSAKKQSDGSYLYTYRIYDVPVCTVTHVAVVLDEAPQRVMFIQYVTVNGDAMTDFTQGIEAWPIWYSTPQEWTRGSYCGGRPAAGSAVLPAGADLHHHAGLLRRVHPGNRHRRVVLAAPRRQRAGVPDLRCRQPDGRLDVSGRLVQLRPAAAPRLSLPGRAVAVAQLCQGR